MQQIHHLVVHTRNTPSDRARGLSRRVALESPRDWVCGQRHRIPLLTTRRSLRFGPSPTNSTLASRMSELRGDVHRDERGGRLVFRDEPDAEDGDRL